MRERVVKLRALQRRIDGQALGQVALVVLLGAGRVGLFEVRVRGIGTVVEVRYRLTAEDLSRLAIVPLVVRWPRWAPNPNMAASAATASFSIWPVAGPPSSAWLFGLISIAAR